METNLQKKLTAEFFGTCWLVLGGCGSAVLAGKFTDVGIGLCAGGAVRRQRLRRPFTERPRVSATR